MDVGTDGKFATPDMTREGRTSTVTTTNQDELWDIIQGEVNCFEEPLRRYNIEPFYSPSSINWIPSRHQEPNHGKGDR